MRTSAILQRLICIPFLLVSMYSIAQSNSRPISDKRITSLLGKIAEDSVKLVRYKGMVSQFEKDKTDADNNAQQSADDDKHAAERLANDPQSKRLARKSRSAAKDAHSASRKARIAGNKLEDLNKDIKELTRKLDKEQTKLLKYQAT